MDLTLDYNVELYPMQNGQEFALALASSLAKGPPGANTEEEEKDSDVWRPDGKGRRGLEEDYDYVMYGKVSVASERISSAVARSPSSCVWVLMLCFRSIGLTAERPRLCACYSLSL